MSCVRLAQSGCNHAIETAAWTSWVNVERGIMHSNSQLTDCFVSLALRRAAHDCITGDGSKVLLYGCAECNWIYSPQTPEETTKKYLLMAQFKFEQHVCCRVAQSD